MSFITDLFINYFPFYNKFRAVSSIQVILELCIPVLAIYSLHTIIVQKKQNKVADKAQKVLEHITMTTKTIEMTFKI